MTLARSLRYLSTKSAAVSSRIPSSTPRSATAAVSARYLNVASKPSDLVGNTPLLDLNVVLQAHGIDNGSKLYAKMESLGPCSSVKDRIGRSMLDAAEAQGLIDPATTTLVEPTSGNTGIALAFIARERGYKCILIMPEQMSQERRMMLLALGAEIVLTPKGKSQSLAPCRHAETSAKNKD